MSDSWSNLCREPVSQLARITPDVCDTVDDVIAVSSFVQCLALPSDKNSAKEQAQFANTIPLASAHLHDFLTHTSSRWLSIPGDVVVEDCVFPSFRVCALGRRRLVYEGTLPQLLVCALRGSRGRTASVLASVLLAAAYRSSVPADTSLSTSHDRNHHLTAMTAPLLSLLHLVLPFRRPLHLVCVEQLAASMSARSCVLAHKPAHTSRRLRPTVSPLPLSPTGGQQPMWRWRQRWVGQRRHRAPSAWEKGRSPVTP